MTKVSYRRFAEKIRYGANPGRPAELQPFEEVKCPNCNTIVEPGRDLSDWPGFPAGIFFNPSDKEVIEHLMAYRNGTTHVFLDVFILTINEDEGICYTLPQHLPGARADGSHVFFYHAVTRTGGSTGRQKRTVRSTALGNCRWHKTGSTASVTDDMGNIIGYKKILVLYTGYGQAGGASVSRSSWIMHQYFLNNDLDDEKVISKVFYRLQDKGKPKRNDSSNASRHSDNDPDLIEGVGEASAPVEPEESAPSFNLSNSSSLIAETSLSQHIRAQHHRKRMVTPASHTCELESYARELEEQLDGVESTKMVAEEAPVAVGESFFDSTRPHDVSHLHFEEPLQPREKGKRQLDSSNSGCSSAQVWTNSDGTGFTNQNRDDHLVPPSAQYYGFDGGLQDGLNASESCYLNEVPEQLICPEGITNQGLSNASHWDSRAEPADAVEGLAGEIFLTASQDEELTSFLAELEGTGHVL